MKMAPILIGFMLLGLLNAFGQLLLKVGSTKLAWGVAGVVRLVMSAVQSPWIVGGVLVSWTCSVIYVAVLAKVRLSVAVPLYVAAVTVASVALASLVLREALSAKQVLGVAVVLTGAYVVLSGG